MLYNNAVLSVMGRFHLEWRSRSHVTELTRLSHRKAVGTVPWAWTTAALPNCLLLMSTYNCKRDLRSKQGGLASIGGHVQ